MPDDWEEEARRAKAALIDTTVPNAARVTDYLYGGQNNFEADRRAARAMAATAPVITAIAPAVRAFQGRVLRFLVAEAGIRQFLDVGTGLPLVGNTHEVAQSLVPECRIAYVDNDQRSTDVDGPFAQGRWPAWPPVTTLWSSSGLAPDRKTSQRRSLR
jgi:hypothetical protein